jgi:type IV secretory pathway VirB10-like protein
MATNTSTFFAGMGTTFVILALGFSGGMMLTRTVTEPRSEQQARAPKEPVRVILPASVEPAQPPQISPMTRETAPPPPAQPPVKETVLPETTVQKVDTRKAEAEERERRKQSSERTAKRLADRAKRQHQLELGQGHEAPIVAFGGNESRQSGGFGFFGN